ncbi:MAG: hypothetical protein E7430_02460 [Ruminococcaceae bacterium]|nr:hypothetical protein [Oscillospiraceae bacterium]
MKQTKVMNLISVLLFAAVVVYIVINVFTAMMNPFKTAYAVKYETFDSATVSGYTVRNETVIYSNSDIISRTRAEGEKVGVGQTIAVAYRDENAEARQSEINSLQKRKAQLENAASGNLSISDSNALDLEIIESIKDLNADVASSAFTGISNSTNELRSLVFSRHYVYGNSDEVDAQLEQIAAQIEALQALSSNDSNEITASAAGIFSAHVDGYESVLTPDMLSSVTVSDFDALSTAAEDTNSGVGKLITSSRWYLLITMDEEDALLLGDYAIVRFSESLQVEMNVERIGLSEKGRCIVVLSSDRQLSDTTVYRSVSVDIIFDIYSGLRIPKTALRMDDDGNTCVYVVEARNAALKYVNIISESGDYYVVEEDTSSTDNLWAGDEVITAGRNLYDGKVID